MEARAQNIPAPARPPPPPPLAPPLAPPPPPPPPPPTCRAAKIPAAEPGLNKASVQHPANNDRWVPASKLKTTLIKSARAHVQQKRHKNSDRAQSEWRQKKRRESLRIASTNKAPSTTQKTGVKKTASSSCTNCGRSIRKR